MEELIEQLIRERKAVDLYNQSQLDEESNWMMQQEQKADYDAEQEAARIDEVDRMGKGDLGDYLRDILSKFITNNPVDSDDYRF